MNCKRQLILFVGVLAFIGGTAVESAAQTLPSGWAIDPEFEFSIRCSKPPHPVEFAGLSGVIVNQIYIRVGDGQLSRLQYSTPLDSPHYWQNSETPVVYRNLTHEGKSKVESKRKFRKSDSESISRIEVSLDASAAQSGLELLLTDFVTYGSWTILKTSGTLTLEENTSIMENGKLTKSLSTYWTRCQLMSKDGAGVYF